MASVGIVFYGQFDRYSGAKIIKQLSNQNGRRLNIRYPSLKKNDKG